MQVVLSDMSPLFFSKQFRIENLYAIDPICYLCPTFFNQFQNNSTDRAYRIGQKNNMMVHRFITQNTFEEKINEMIQNKKALDEMTVATGKNEIGNLSNKELNEIFGRG